MSNYLQIITHTNNNTNEINDINIGLTFKIIDERLRSSIVGKMLQFIIKKKFKHFDFKNDFNILKDKKLNYIAYVNTDQEYVYLFFTQINGIDHCLFIRNDEHKKFQVKVVRVFVEKSYYQDGLILEGELWKDKDSVHFIVNDVIMYKYQKILSTQEKLVLLDKLFSTYKYDGFLESFKLELKDFIPSYELLSFLNNDIYQLPYYDIIRGMTFKPENQEHIHFLYGGSQKKEDDIQVKDSEQVKDQENEGDKNKVFMVYATSKPDVYLLKLKDKNGNYVKYDYALLNDLKTSKLLNKQFNNTQTQGRTKSQTGYAYKCKYNEKFKMWKPIKQTKKDADMISGQ